MAASIVVFTLAVLLGGMVINSLAAHRRKQAMAWLAKELELRYRRLSPDLFRENLDRLVEVRELLPGYLFPSATSFPT